MSSISWSLRWRNFGIVWAYVFFNMVVAMALYYTFRVRKWTWADRPKPLLKAFYWIIEAGYYVRALLVGDFAKSPRDERDARQHALF